MENRDTYGNLVPLQLLQRIGVDTYFAIGYWVYTNWRCIAIRENLRWWDECSNWDEYTRNKFWKCIDTGQSIEEFMERHFEIFL